jgi:hypothetical protein
MEEGYVTQIGYPRLRIDILNTIDGVKFENSYPNKLLVDVNGIEVRYIGLKEFIENTTASYLLKNVHITTQTVPYTCQTV